jgi:cytoskeletal protein CcmA (bactofilin family)
MTLRPNGDVLAAGEDVRIADSVPGDAMAAGGSIVFDGVLGGSYVGAGGDQEIRGRIDGSVRAAGGTVIVAADVGRNATLVGGTLTLGREANVQRNAYLAGGRVRMDGSVDGDLYVGAGQVVLDGVVAGDVRVEAERLTLGPKARVGGDLRYRTEEGVAEIDPAARITGKTEALEPREDHRPVLGIWWSVFRVLAFLVTGTVLVALFPTTLATLGSTMGRRAGASLGFGALTVVAVPLAAAITAVTILGLPLAAMAAVLFGVSLYLAPVIPSLWIGDTLLSGREASARRKALERFFLGGLIVAIVVLLPWIGLLTRLVVVLLGLGAVALTLFGPREAAATSA